MSNVRTVTGAGRTSSSSCRYISYCISSVSSSAGRPASSSSDRNRPMPSAPCDMANVASPSRSTFASTRMSTPSAVFSARAADGSLRCHRRPAASRRRRHDRVRTTSRRRIDRDRALVAVDEDQRARQDSGGRIVQPHDRGHVERSGEDRRVIGAAAGVGDERLELAPVELRRDRWGQLVGHEDAGRLALAQHVAESGTARREIHAKAADHVGEIALALAQVRIFDAVEDRAEVIEHLLQRPFCVHALLADNRRGSRHQHRVVDHEPLRLEQRAQIAARQPKLNAIELLRRAPPRVLEPGDLGVDSRGRDGKAEHLRALNQHDSAPRSDAARHADAA